MPDREPPQPNSTDVFTSARSNRNGSFTGQVAVIRQFDGHATEDIADVPGEHVTLREALEAAEAVARHQRS